MHHLNGDWQRSRRSHVFSDIRNGRYLVRHSHHRLFRNRRTSERPASASSLCSALAASPGSVSVGHRFAMASCRPSSSRSSARRRRHCRAGVHHPLGSDFDRLVFATASVPAFSCSACTTQGLTSALQRTAAMLLRSVRGSNSEAPFTLSPVRQRRSLNLVVRRIPCLSAPVCSGRHPASGFVCDFAGTRRRGPSTMLRVNKRRA